MRWIKKGVVFVADHQYDWMVSHAQIPLADPGGDFLRIYFSTRDAQGRSQPARIDVDADDPRRILRVHDRPLLPLGPPGTFDDSGIMPSWIVDHDSRKYLYYVGWNRQVTVSYRLAIGLAVSDDGGESFRKISLGPICDRDLYEPYFCTAPCVLREGDAWRMWYISCTGWETIDSWPEPRYLVRYAESSDGVHWRRPGRVCIDYDERTDAIGRPCVYRADGIYKMLFSYRRVRGYRSDRARSYRLGYAESADGLEWTRRDDAVGIERSENGWDSEMMAYSHVIERAGRTHLFYNGNGFGRSGFGWAVVEE